VALCVCTVAPVVRADDVPCDVTPTSIVIGGYSYDFSTCDSPGAHCHPAPCGQDGRCQRASFYNNPASDCFCAQTAYLDDFINTVGYAESAVVGQGEYPWTMLLDMCPNGSLPHHELVPFFNDGVELDHVLAPMTGSMSIEWSAPTSGTLLDFDLSFDSYDFFGQATGTNTWTMAAPGSIEVWLDIFEEKVYPVEPVPLVVENDLGTFPGWLDFSFTTAYTTSEITLLKIRGAQEAPDHTGAAVHGLNWTTIKALYR
jgi:hypothetical protein